MTAVPGRYPAGAAPPACRASGLPGATEPDHGHIPGP
jgi:hypothetical protein